MKHSSAISAELKDLVSMAVKALGQTIEQLEGKDFFHEIEKIRLAMKQVRGSDPARVQESLTKLHRSYEQTDSEHLRKIVKSFSLMLETINACEAAYRRRKLSGKSIVISKQVHSLIYVFTSHPTEARNKNFLKIMSRVEELLLDALLDKNHNVDKELKYLFTLAFKIDISNQKRPTVEDEARQIIELVLDHEILNEQIDLKQKGIDVLFRTWSGGDKDGHPGVGLETMIKSWDLSRSKLLQFVNYQIKIFKDEINLVDEKNLLRLVRSVESQLAKIKKVGIGDGKKIIQLKKVLKLLFISAEACKMNSPAIKKIEDLIWLYPALVLPLELREDSAEINEALTKKNQPIEKMLKGLKLISSGMNPKWYARGLVISMCTQSQHIISTRKLIIKCLGGFHIPAVPLFENKEGISNCIKILTESFSQFNFTSYHHKNWGGRFEVMIGYSDSSKENGVLPGKTLLFRALFKLDRFLKKNQLTPVFFHGSGGSISRGGGSIKDQTAWLPRSALKLFKSTIQGEMVQRNFQRPLIMRSQVSKIIQGFEATKKEESRLPKSIDHFSNAVLKNYRNLVEDSSFQEMVASVTPYNYLNRLKIGSRPTKRAAEGDFSLRAIPWVLCWTQTRLLLPVWWGVGSAWFKTSDGDKAEIKNFFKESSFLQTFVKNLGFTLAKIELGVLIYYVERSSLSKENKKFWIESIKKEHAQTCRFFYEITGSSNFTYFRPWLGESILFRSSMIHPLNVFQKIAMSREDDRLLRESVTGISCGMLTTG